MGDKELLNRDEVVRRLKAAQGGDTQEVFAVKVGISQSMLSSIYSGARAIPKVVEEHLGLEAAEKFWVEKVVKRGGKDKVR
jgi:transcriptional regulator with XRE-family HTH domain